MINTYFIEELRISFILTEDDINLIFNNTEEDISHIYVRYELLKKYNKDIDSNIKKEAFEKAKKHWSRIEKKLNKKDK